MIDLRRLDQIKNVQAVLRTTFGSDSGKEVMRFLEQICGWFDFNETDKDAILIAHGKRQVLATLKTLLEYKPEEIMAIAKQKEL
jgi:hypothetical protein